MYWKGHFYTSHSVYEKPTHQTSIAPLGVSSDTDENAQRKSSLASLFWGGPNEFLHEKSATRGSDPVVEKIGPAKGAPDEGVSEKRFPYPLESRQLPEL